MENKNNIGILRSVIIITLLLAAISAMLFLPIYRCPKITIEHTYTYDNHYNQIDNQTRVVNIISYNGIDILSNDVAAEFSGEYSIVENFWVITMGLILLLFLILLIMILINLFKPIKAIRIIFNITMIVNILLFLLSYGIVFIGNILFDQINSSYFIIGFLCFNMCFCTFNYEKHSIEYIAVFSVLTLGLYTIIWAIKTIQLINNIDSKSASLIKELLCFIFIPFYYVYWFYNYSNRLALISEDKKVKDLPKMVTIISVFTKLPAVLLMQAAINEYENSVLSVLE